MATVVYLVCTPDALGGDTLCYSSDVRGISVLLIASKVTASALLKYFPAHAELDMRRPCIVFALERAKGGSVIICDRCPRANSTA